MSTKKVKLAVAMTLALMIALALVISIIAQDDAEYVGNKKCKMCHSKQYKSWKTTTHANNYAQLVEMGKAEDAECLKCHTTGYGKPGGFEPGKENLAKDPILRGTGCEACHGPGSGYWKMKVMKDLYAGTIEPESVGLWVITEETCTGCHTEEGNSFYVEFNYEEALETVAHPVPEKKAKK